MSSRLQSLLLILASLPGFTQTRAEWQQAYLYAYPLVLMDVTREAQAAKAAANTFAHSRAFPTEESRTIVRPNADTLYSSAWLDLSKEPILLRLPDTGGRYYLMQVLDAWTETVAAPGKRTSGTEEGWFALVGPGWKGKLPAKVKQRIDCPTNMVWLLGRTQTNGPEDYEKVHRIQDGFRLMPLRQYQKSSAGTEFAFTTPPAIVEQMSDTRFFERFMRLLASNPAHATDTAMLDFMRRAGPLPPAVPTVEFSEGVQAAKSMLGVVEQLRTTIAGASGWTGVSSNVGRYGTNYMARAVVARVGLGANPPEDAVYLSCYKDPTGKPLRGSFQMHFAKSELPPVEAFWSITAYDSQGYFVANPARRFAVGDRDALHFNADGSLDLTIQSEAPKDPLLHANWLPSPATGTFNLMFRLYWPKPEILSGKWMPPPVLPLR